MILFVGGVALLIYVIAGYPLLLAWLWRTRQRPVAKAPHLATVSVVIAVRNGERWIRDKLNYVFHLDYPRELIEVFVISDGSSDQTDAIVGEFASERVHLIQIPASGKAAALNAGIERATGDILFFTDVRQPLDPACLRHLVNSLADPSVGVVSGEITILDGKSQTEVATGAYWAYEKWIRRRLGAIDSVPGASGAVYAMRRSLAVSMPADTLLDDVYLPMQAFHRGYRLIWDESAKVYDYPTSFETEFRRKIRTLAGVYQLVMRCPWLLTPANRMLFHFLSHKVGRLLLPFGMIAVALGTFGLPSPYFKTAAAVQVLFYGMALIDPLLPHVPVLKRLTSSIRMFVVMTAAALCAVSILFVPARYFWKETRLYTAAPQ